MRVVLAEDLYLLRDGLTHLLEAHDFEIAAVVATGHSLALRDLLTNHTRHCQTTGGPGAPTHQLAVSVHLVRYLREIGYSPGFAVMAARRTAEPADPARARGAGTMAEGRSYLGAASAALAGGFIFPR